MLQFSHGRDTGVGFGDRYPRLYAAGQIYRLGKDACNERKPGFETHHRVVRTTEDLIKSGALELAFWVGIAILHFERAEGQELLRNVVLGLVVLARLGEGVIAVRGAQRTRK